MSILNTIKQLVGTEAQGVQSLYHGLNPFDKQGFTPQPQPAPQPSSDQNIPWGQYLPKQIQAANPVNTQVHLLGSPSMWGIRTPAYNPYLGQANYFATPLQHIQFPNNLPLYLQQVQK